MKTRAALFSVIFLAAGVAASRDALAGNFAATSLTDHVLMVTGPHGNTLVGVDAGGLVLVDGVPEPQAEEYLEFIGRETGVTTVKALFNTHWHSGPTGLNDLLGKQDIPIIAHEITSQWLAATIRVRGEEIIHTPVPAHALPTHTIYTEDHLPFRGGAIDYGHLLQAHTDGDIYVYFADENVLYAGHVLRSDAFAAVDQTTNGYLGGFMDAWRALSEIIDEETLIVPATGPVMDKTAFDRQHEMYQALMKEMVALLRKAKSAEEVVALDPATPLRPQWSNAAEFLDQGFRSFFYHLRDARHLGGMP